MSTRIPIIDAALVRIGASPVQSEDAPGADSLILTYDSVVRAIVSGHPWTFQRGFQQLNRQAQTPQNAWKYGFSLPATMDGSPVAVFAKKGDRQPIQHLEIIGRTLYADEPELWARFTKAPEPGLWPGYFHEVIIKALMAEYAMQVREDVSMSRALKGEVYGSDNTPGELGLLGMAKARDAYGAPAPVVQIGDNPLTSVRFS